MDYAYYFIFSIYQFLDFLTYCTFNLEVLKKAQRYRPTIIQIHSIFYFKKKKENWFVSDLQDWLTRKSRSSVPDEMRIFYHLCLIFCSSSPLIFSALMRRLPGKPLSFTHNKFFFRLLK